MVMTNNLNKNRIISEKASYGAKDDVIFKLKNKTTNVALVHVSLKIEMSEES